jgi:hypothetical protein
MGATWRRRWSSASSVCYKCPAGSITDPLKPAGGAVALTECGECLRCYVSCCPRPTTV